jgi:hypothetical protein
MKKFVSLIKKPKPKLRPTIISRVKKCGGCSGRKKT